MGILNDTKPFVNGTLFGTGESEIENIYHPTSKKMATIDFENNEPDS